MHFHVKNIIVLINSDNAMLTENKLTNTLILFKKSQVYIRENTFIFYGWMKHSNIFMQVTLSEWIYITISLLYAER